MKRAPPPEKRHQVNKKAERSSEAYPTPQTQSANTKTQTTAMLTWRKGRQQEGHTTEHTPTLKSSRHQHAPRRPRHTHGWDNPRALPPQTTTGRGENPLTKVSKSIFSSGVFIRRKRRRFWSQLLTVSNCRWLSLAVAVSSSPSRSFTATKLLRLALSSSSLGFRSGEEKASILSNGGVLRSCKTGPSTSAFYFRYLFPEQPEFEDGFNENAEDLATTMLELWNLMDTPIEEQQEYQHITCNIAASEHEITQANT
ncbi:hypothetical protein YC2023_037214 [Brassica napus]